MQSMVGYWSPQQSGLLSFSGVSLIAMILVEKNVGHGDVNTFLNK
jgi:hypothetical protein